MPDTSKDLKTMLLATAAQWCAAHRSSGTAATERVAETRFGKAVANDGNFLKRLRSGGGLSVVKLEDAARFLHDSANWPEGLVPVEACELAHRVGVSAADTDASPGKIDEFSREKAA